jgi:stage V sporulation protein B
MTSAVHHGAHMNREVHGRRSAAGRGVLFLTISKGYFILAGYAIVFMLPRLLSKEMFADYVVVTGIVSVLDAVLITGTIQAVSKYVSQEPRYAEAVKIAAVRMQLLVGGGIFLAYFLGASVFANALHDPGLVPALRISSLIVISYAFYAIYIGFINGLKKFGKQACLDMGFSTLKLVLVLGVGFYMSRFPGFGAMGAIGGFALAAFFILIVALCVVSSPPREGRFGMGVLFQFALFIMVFTFIVTLLLRTDLFLLKRLLSGEKAKIFPAYYGAAQYLAFIPYQAIIAITFVIFPLISHLTHIEERGKVRDYIREALRYSIIIALLIATLFSSSSYSLMRLIFPAGYETAAVVLSILVFGILFFSIFLVSTTVISGSGRPRLSAVLGAGTLTLSFILNSLLIPRFGMKGAAIATTCAMGTGLIAAWLYLRVHFGACLPLFSLLRIAVAGAVVYLLSMVFPAAGFLLLVKLPLLALVYVAALFVLKELGRPDLQRVKGILGRA